MRQFEVIFCDRADTEVYMIAHVTAPTAGAAQDECNWAVQDKDSLFHGCDFTIWPVPVA